MKTCKKELYKKTYTKELNIIKNIIYFQREGEEEERKSEKTILFFSLHTL